VNLDARCTAQREGCSSQLRYTRVSAAVSTSQLGRDHKPLIRSCFPDSMGPAEFLEMTHAHGEDIGTICDSHVLAARDLDAVERPLYLNRVTSQYSRTGKINNSLGRRPPRSLRMT
jgi:hypothetical protein